MIDPLNFSSIFQVLPGNYIILLPDAPRFTIAAFNDARAEQTFTRPEHIGKGIFEAFPDNPDDPQANGVSMLTASLQTVMREKKPHQMAVQKYDIPTADRTGFEERYWLPRNIPVLDDKGEILYIIHHVQDTTAQLLAERREKTILQELSDEITARKKIAHAEETTRLALGSGDLGTYELNHLTDELITSPRFNAIWGFDQPMDHAAFQNAVHEDDKALRLAAYEESLHTGTLFYEVRAVWKDGSIHWVRVNGKTIYDARHKPIRLIGVVQDITDQKTFTDELTRLVEERTTQLKSSNEQLATSNQELQQFAYISSHDLQEPLRKIQVYASRIFQSNEWTPRSVSDLEKISTAATRMRGLINDLLDYSRLDHDKAAFQKIDLNEVFRQVLADFEFHITQNKATVRAKGLETIEAVPLHMHQLFINLIGNALKFARKDLPLTLTITGSKLSAAKKQTFPSLKLNRDYHEIVFSDNGIGFDQANAEKIFNLFQRLSHKGTYAGHGIGLALCSKVVSHHRGIISAEGAMNEGANFTIILPYSQN